MIRSYWSLVALLTFVFASSSSAAIISFTNRAQWEAAVAQQTQTIDFSTLTSGTSNPINFRRVIDDLIIDPAAILGASNTRWVSASNNGTARTSPNNTRYLLLDTGNSSNPRFTPQFDEPVFAFGFDLANDFSQHGVTIRIDNAIVASGVNINTSRGRGRSGFIGFIDDEASIESFTVFMTSFVDVGIDNLSYVTAANLIPEPSALLLSCLPAWLLTTRRR